MNPAEPTRATVLRRVETLPVDVSIVIPAFNRAGHVERAIESVLSQDSPLRNEVIVVDDGSSDDTRDRLRAYAGKIVVIAFERNLGRNHARNAGLRKATGEWVKFLDSDDVLEPGSLAQEVAAGRAHAARIVATSFRTAGLSGVGATIHPVPEFRSGIDGLLAGEAVPTSAALYRRSALGAMEWDPALGKLDDWDFFIRAALRCGNVLSYPLVSYTWIQHEGQGVRSSGMVDNAREHHVILRGVEACLSGMGALTPERRLRLAQYYYKELRVLCLHDRIAFEEASEHILELDPLFHPRDEERQWWMRGLARLVGFRAAVLTHTAVKRALKGSRSAGAALEGVR